MAREFYSGASTTVRLDFETPLHPCGDHRACDPFDPSLLTPEGLAAYAAANPVTGGEVFLINNALKTHYSDKYSLGMCNLFDLLSHALNFSVTIVYIRCYYGISFPLHRQTTV